MAAAVLSYRLGYPPPSFRSCSPRPIDTRNGENDGEGCLLDGVGLVPVWFACLFDCVWYGMATAIAFIVWVFLIACPSSCDCRAIPRRSMRVVMWSGLDQARSFPRLLRIPCGFVSFRPFPAPSPRAASSRAHPIPSRFVPSYPPNPLNCFALIAYHAPPVVS